MTTKIIEDAGYDDESRRWGTLRPGHATTALQMLVEVWDATHPSIPAVFQDAWAECLFDLARDEVLNEARVTALLEDVRGYDGENAEMLRGAVTAAAGALDAHQSILDATGHPESQSVYTATALNECLLALRAMALISATPRA